MKLREQESNVKEVLRPSATPEPLRGNEPETFAEDTLTRRLPGIARRVLREWDWHVEARLRLEELAQDMPYGWLRPLQDPGAPDEALWAEWLTPYLGQTWLDAPWFAAEVYFFRRILEATGYFQDGPGRGVDPYQAQKRAGLEAALKPLAAACAALSAEKFSTSKSALEAALTRLLRTVVWGNQADLSLWPAGQIEAGDPPDRPDAELLAAHLLVDDSPTVSRFVVQRNSRLARVDFILDNTGLELGYDLLLTDFLLEHELTQTVVYHAKPFPTYVSDVTVPEVEGTIGFLLQNGDEGLRSLARRLGRRLKEDQLRVQSEYYWTSPLAGWEAPMDLRRELAQADLIISKGDANYRRWLGDRHWPFTVPFSAVLAYRPAPLLALRVNKAELIVGLPPGKQEEMDTAHPGWLSNGQWGVIQFAE